MTFREWNALRILGLDASASRKEIQKRYAELVKEHRPDVDPAGFQRLHDAYLCLTRQGKDGNIPGDLPAEVTWKRNPSGDSDSKQAPPYGGFSKGKDFFKNDFDFSEELSGGFDSPEQENCMLDAAEKELSDFFAGNQHGMTPEEMKGLFGRPQIMRCASVDSFAARFAEHLKQNPQNQDVCRVISRYFGLDHVLLADALPYGKRELWTALRENAARAAASQMTAFFREKKNLVRRSRVKKFFESSSIHPYAKDEPFMASLSAELERDDVSLKRPIVSYLLKYYGFRGRKAPSKAAGTEEKLRSNLLSRMRGALWKDGMILALLALIFVPIPAALAAPGTRTTILCVKWLLVVGSFILYEILDTKMNGRTALFLITLFSLPIVYFPDIRLILYMGVAGQWRLFLMAEMMPPFTYTYFFLVASLLHFAKQKSEERKKAEDLKTGRIRMPKMGGDSGDLWFLFGWTFFVHFYCFLMSMALIIGRDEEGHGIIADLLVLFALIWVFAGIIAVVLLVKAIGRTLKEE